MKILSILMFVFGCFVSQAYAADLFASEQEANTKAVAYLDSLNTMADAFKEYCGIEDTVDGPACVRYVPNVLAASIKDLTVEQQQSAKAGLLVLQKNIGLVNELKLKLWHAQEVIPEDKYLKIMATFDDAKLEEFDNEFNLIRFYARAQSLKYQTASK